MGSGTIRGKTVPGLGLDALTVEIPAFRHSCRRAEAAMFRGMLAPGDEERVGLYREAESAARGAVGLAPDRPEGHYLLAVTLGLRIDFVGALEKVRMAQEIRDALLAGRPPSNPTSLIRGREALDARGSSPEGLRGF